MRGLIQRETLVLGGGGAWSDRYPGGQRLAARASRFFRRIVVLPSSFGAPVSLRAASLWARDRFGSLECVPAARFCHDLGFAMGRIDAPPPSEVVGEFFRNDRLSSAPRTASAADLSSQGTERFAASLTGDGRPEGRR
jgi:hypothetical protein